jgi:hypothetical protein
MAMFFLTPDIMIIYYKVTKNYNTYGGDDYGVLEVCRVPIFQNLLWFLLCLGSSFSLSFTHCCKKSYGVNHYVIEECPN